VSASVCSLLLHLHEPSLYLWRKQRSAKSMAAQQATAPYACRHSPWHPSRQQHHRSLVRRSASTHPAILRASPLPTLSARETKIKQQAGIEPWNYNLITHLTLSSTGLQLQSALVVWIDLETRRLLVCVPTLSPIVAL
jgi:hypothetical protein